jgi:hypothetical protein
MRWEPNDSLKRPTYAPNRAEAQCALDPSSSSVSWHSSRHWLRSTRAPAQAQTPQPPVPGRIITGSIPADGGFGLVVFGGGAYDELVTASGCPAPQVAFWATVSGTFIVYIPATTVGAVNAPFEATFPNRTIPPYTPFVGRCTPVTGSGIEGTVTLGPVCAVQSDILPCPDRPYQVATIIFYNALVACPALTCGEVARISTDGNGRYRVALPPGAYSVVPQPAGSGVFPHLPSPVMVTVVANTYVTVNFSYDTGIRSVQ